MNASALSAPMGAHSPYLWAFPVNLEAEFRGALDTYQDVSKAIGVFVGTALAYRCILSLLKTEGMGAFGAFLSDVVTYFVLIAVFPDILQHAAHFVAAITHAIPNSLYTERAGEVIRNLHEKSFFDFLKSLTWWDFIFGVIDLIPAILWWFSTSLATALCSVTVTLTPIIFFFSTVARVHGGLAPLVTSYLSLFLWPVAWTIVGSLSSRVISSMMESSPFTGLMLSIFFQVVQLLSPLWTGFLLRGNGLGGALMRSLFTAAGLTYGASRGVGVIRGGISRSREILRSLDERGVNFPNLNGGRIKTRVWSGAERNSPSPGKQLPQLGWIAQGSSGGGGQSSRQEPRAPRGGGPGLTGGRGGGADLASNLGNGARPPLSGKSVSRRDERGSVEDSIPSSFVKSEAFSERRGGPSSVPKHSNNSLGAPTTITLKRGKTAWE